MDHPCALQGKEGPVLGCGFGVSNDESRRLISRLVRPFERVGPCQVVAK